jgi:hypothetical protein
MFEVSYESRKVETEVSKPVTPSEHKLWDVGVTNEMVAVLRNAELAGTITPSTENDHLPFL